MFLLVLRRFRPEPVWLLVPVLFLLPLWIDALYELSVGTGDAPPAIIRPIFAACYIAGYVTMPRATRDLGTTEARQRNRAGATGAI